MKVIFELPHQIIEHGGISYTVSLAKHLQKDKRFEVHLRFQKGYDEYSKQRKIGEIGIPYTIGYPDETFPACDIAITYSDTLHLKQLIELPQVKRVLLNMLSWGMSANTERDNVGYPVEIITTSERTKVSIEELGHKVIKIGHGFDVDKWFITNPGERKNYLALLYNDLPAKRYKLAVEIADKLYDEGIIEGVMTLGCDRMYNQFQHPKGLVRHIHNATSEQIRQLFNECKCFLMPSSTEGFNLTPIESTLCGCPAVLCDGAIDTVFISGENCYVYDKNEIKFMTDTIFGLMKAEPSIHWLSVLYPRPQWVNPLPSIFVPAL